MEKENNFHHNPFLEPYNTPHDTVPFDRIETADYEEAFMEGIRRDDEDTENTITNPEEPTFDNTIAKYDHSKGPHYYDLLDRVSNAFFCMLGAETNDEMDALAQKMSPILTKHANDILLNGRLFKRIKAVYDNHRDLNPEEQTLLQTTYDNFVRNGALLDDAGKEKLRALTERENMLSLQFSQNLLKDTKAFKLHITDEKQLGGLPESARSASKMLAESNNTDGWIFTLDHASYQPFMTYSTQRDLRRKLFLTRGKLCTNDNKENNLEICRQIVNLRREIAQLLGFETYADYVLKQRMVGNAGTVDKLFDDLINAYKPTSLREVEAVSNKAKEMEGDDFVLQPWDFAFYSHELQLERFNLDAEMLRPYFQLENVTKGIFGLATRLYGITFKENKEIPVYHKDVRTYEVFDEDGGFLAVLYADFHPRKGKQGGAWMTEFQGQHIGEDGTNVRPHVLLVMNLTKPTKEKPALLTLGEVNTFIHEFGHALHGIFANTRFESLSGTNVWWDFVELPSQLMENFVTEREFLRTFAFHYQTGEVIPDELISRIVDSKNYLASYSCMRQVSFGLLDMAYYTLKEEMKEEIIPFEKRAWSRAIVMPQAENTCMTTQFSHIMSGGYAAGYYSYKWAEVLAADAFSQFRKNGVFDKSTAKSFRENVLSKGGTEHPMKLYKRFRGKEPTIDALLVRDGIKSEGDKEQTTTAGR